MAISTIKTKQKNEIEAVHHEHGNYGYDKYVFAPWGSGKCTVNIYDVPPGKSSYPFHYHTASEEVFYIISGEGVIETVEGDLEVSAGSVVICPAGEGGSHKLTNTSNTEVLSYLDVDTVPDVELIKYPKTNKIGVVTSKGGFKLYKEDSSVPYYEGE